MKTHLANFILTHASLDIGLIQEDQETSSHKTLKNSTT